MANHLGAFWTLLPRKIEPAIIIGPPPGGGGTDTPGGVVENPDGGGGGGVIVPDEGPRYAFSFSATVVFRLHRGISARSFPLGDFGPLVDWPQTMLDATFTLWSGDKSFVATLQPDSLSSAAWQVLYPTDTVVQPQPPENYDARDARPVRSFPRVELADSMQAFHTEPQFVTGDVVRSRLDYAQLQTRIAPIINRNIASPAIAAALAADASNPAKLRTFSRARRQLLPSGQREASDFLQLVQYYERLDDHSGDNLQKLPRPALPEPDFHTMAALALTQPPVARALGLVLDFVAVVDESVFGPRRTRLEVDYDASDVTREDVSYLTWVDLSATRVSVPSENAPDMVGGYLRLGDTSQFHVEDGYDLDGGALKLRELANFITASPRATDLPALRTVGMGINRKDVAEKVASTRSRDRTRFNRAFANTGDVGLVAPGASRQAVPDFTNYAEDLVRGYRFDVYDETQQRWFSLHKRRGHFRVGVGREDEQLLDVADEGFVTPTTLKPAAFAQNQDAPLDEYYVSESIARWQGWSLSVPRVGSPITNEDIVLPREGDEPNGKVVYPGVNSTLGGIRNEADQAFDLPRLRFGRSYRFRARVVDAAGNSQPFDESIPPEEYGDAVSAPTKFKRYDSMEAPTLLLRALPSPGENAYELVVRSDDENDDADDTSARLVPPPPAVSQWLLEAHGKFDPSIDNNLFNEQYADLLEAREARTWEHSPLSEPVDSRFGGAIVGEVMVPITDPAQDVVPVPYLSDPLVARALFTNMPDFHRHVGFVGTWPGINAAKLRLRKADGAVGPGESSARDDVVEVLLTKGDVRRIYVSSALRDQFPYDDEGDPDLLGLFQWILNYAASKNDPNPPRHYRQLVAEGFHRAISPPREIKLVHAVRRPLFAPSVTLRPQGGVEFLLDNRRPGDTFVTAVGKFDHSRRSTGRIDIRADWTDPVDRGPGDPQDATTTADQSRIVLQREFTREAVPAGLTNDVGAMEFDAETFRHELGDTKHHYVRYTPIATSAFLQYFRETERVVFTLASTHALGDGTPLSEAPVTVRGVSGREYTEGFHYGLNRAAATITRRTLLGGQLGITEPVDVSFIPGVIDRAGPSVNVHVPATARPARPSVHSVVPTFDWARNDITRFGTKFRTSRRSGGGLRVWLDRPWWSSGEGEQLAVVLASSGSGHIDNRQLISLAGTDPTVAMANVTRFLTPAAFSEHARGPVNVVLTETGRQALAMVYDVHYDEGRDQYYADIVVNPSLGDREVGFFPFVRLALARFQHYAITTDVPAKTGDPSGADPVNRLETLQLSSVVLADFTQVAPRRVVNVFKGVDPDSGRSIASVTVTGETFTYMQPMDEPENTPDQTKPKGRGPSDMVVTLQVKNANIADAVLQWSDVTRLTTREAARYTTSLTPNAMSRTNATWQGSVELPTRGAGRSPEYRLLIEEFQTLFVDGDKREEVLYDDPNLGPYDFLVRVPTGRRCVFQDMIPLSGL